MKIVDQSHHKPGITANIFAESLEKLPHVASAGDIIELSHVTVLDNSKSYEYFILTYFFLHFL